MQSFWPSLVSFLGRRVVAPAFALCLAGAVAAADAATISITNIEGQWTAAASVNTPNPTLAIDNNIAPFGTEFDSVRWGGDPTNVLSGSGFSFAEAGNIADVAVGTPFALGTFTHANFQTPPESRIESADYQLAFSTSGSPNLVSVSLRFELTETLNQAPCPFGGVGDLCNDRVTALTAAFNLPIEAGGTTYFLNLVGFSTNGGATVAGVFDTVERGFSPATFYGLLTAAPLASRPLPAVPEPATTLLMAAGLGVAVTRVRGRARR